MHVLGLQPLDQCGVHDADALAFPAGEVDVDGTSSLRQQDKIRVIHRIGLAADGLNGEGLIPSFTNKVTHAGEYGMDEGWQV